MSKQATWFFRCQACVSVVNDANHQDPVTASHLPGGKPGSVAKVRPLGHLPEIPGSYRDITSLRRNLSEDVPGYIGAPAIALSYPWTHFICGHLGRLATRDDVAVHQAYIADIEASAREVLATVDPVPFYMRYGENAWAGVKAHLDTVTERAAAPIVAKYTGVLAAADIEVFTWTTTFQIMQSLRLDRGPSGPVHP